MKGLEGYYTVGAHTKYKGVVVGEYLSGRSDLSNSISITYLWIRTKEGKFHNCKASEFILTEPKH